MSIATFHHPMAIDSPVVRSSVVIGPEPRTASRRRVPPRKALAPAEAPETPYWFRTFTGKQFRLFEPRAKDVCIEDIATALSRVNRFGGHSRVPYTVAEHSVMVSRILPTLAALLHDAAEAYIGDMITPLKRSLEAFAVVELGIQAAIAERFNVNISEFCVPEMKQADLIALSTERRDLMPGDLSPWGKVLPPLPERIVPHCNSEVARGAFIERFFELGGEA